MGYISDIEFFERHGIAASRVSGRCMEGMGIYNGDYIAVDSSKFPKPNNNDVCLCYAKYPGEERPELMAKEYIGVWGTMQLVGTRYIDRMNCGFKPISIIGVIFAVYSPCGALRWEKDISDYPERLGRSSTIRGDNMGEPVEPRTAGVAV